MIYCLRRRKRTLKVIGSPHGDSREIGLRPGEYCYTLPKVKKVDSGECLSERFPYTRVKQIQEARRDKGLFVLDKPLILHVVDITGKRYRISTSVTPNTFLVERTCKNVASGPFD